jgi:hypothetical protein
MIDSDNIAAEMHQLAQKNKVVALVWTPKDVQELLATSLANDFEVTIEQAQDILLEAEQDIQEVLWSSARRYFELAKKEIITVKESNND